MEDLQKIELAFNEIFKSNNLILGVLSQPRTSQLSTKITIRPILIKNKRFFQITENRQNQALHHNLPEKECLEWVKDRSHDYKQIYFYTNTVDYHLLIGKKGNVTLLKKPATKAPLALAHNRQKNYALPEGNAIPFLVHLGVMNEEGKVYPAKWDKFRQINRFIEMIEDVLPHLDPHQCVRIVDFGCGKAYLTFALYHFLKISKGYQVHITGLDLKKELIQYCHELAQALGYVEDLQFIHGDIKEYNTGEKVYLMIPLHACDTATDAALEKAILWKAKVILCVPCCQHELISQVKQEALRPLLKHGILKERFAALATDAARAQLLEVVGYQTQVLEFIDMEHTPKNLLIRAVKKEECDSSSDAWKAYLTLKKHLSINPYLERCLLADNRISL